MEQGSYVQVIQRGENPPGAAVLSAARRRGGGGPGWSLAPEAQSTRLSHGWTLSWAALPSLLPGSGASFATDQAGDTELGCVEARVGCAAVGRRNVGLPFPAGWCVGCHRKRWASEVLLGPQGKDRILSKCNFSVERHFHSEGG